MANSDDQLTYPLTFQDVVQILQIVDETSFRELKLDLGELSMHVVSNRTEAGSSAADASPASLPAPVVGGNGTSTVPRTALMTQPAGIASEAVLPEPSTAQSKPARTPTSVCAAAQVGGIFYRTPGPGEPPYVEVGSQVKAGDTVGLVEVMKLFTPVPSPATGTVVEILARHEEVVMSGQEVVVIEPSAD